MTPKENMDNRFAKSSIASCRGVRFSSTYWRQRQLIPSPLTSCIIEKMTPNSESLPVPTTIPDP
jgi:hypothetical protein